MRVDFNDTDRHVLVADGITSAELLTAVNNYYVRSGLYPRQAVYLRDGRIVRLEPLPVYKRVEDGNL